MKDRLSQSFCAVCSESVMIHQPQPRRFGKDEIFFDEQLNTEHQQFIQASYEVLMLWDQLYDERQCFMLGKITQARYIAILAEARIKIVTIARYLAGLAMQLPDETTFYFNSCQHMINEGVNVSLDPN